MLPTEDIRRATNTTKVLAHSAAIQNCCSWTGWRTSHASTTFQALQICPICSGFWGGSCCSQLVRAKRNPNCPAHGLCAPDWTYNYTHTHAWSIIWQCLMYGINLAKLYANNLYICMYMRHIANICKHASWRKASQLQLLWTNDRKAPLPSERLLAFSVCSDLLCLPDLLGDNSEPPFGETVLSHPLNQHLPWVTQKVFPSFFIMSMSTEVRRHYRITATASENHLLL